MPVYLNEKEQHAYLKANERPTPMLDLLAAAGFRAVEAALKLGIFAALREEPLPVTTLAKRIKADRRGTQILLEALVGFGYITVADGRYANSPISAKWMFPVAEANNYDYTVIHRFWATILFQLWGNIEESIQTGKSAVNFYQWLEANPQTQRDFQTMLSSGARVTAKEIVETITLPATATRLLDLGGSHALHSLAFCQHHPTLQATIFDYPVALSIGQQNVAEADMTTRIQFQTGDFTTDPLGQGYDIVLLFNIVHGLLPAENIHLLQRVKAALNPGGLVVILEQLAGETGDQPSRMADTFNRTFKLNLFHLLGAQTYRLDEVKAWLAEAGFDYQQHTVLQATRDSLVVAQKVAAE